MSTRIEKLLTSAALTILAAVMAGCASGPALPPSAPLRPLPDPERLRPTITERVLVVAVQRFEGSEPRFLWGPRAVGTGELARGARDNELGRRLYDRGSVQLGDLSFVLDARRSPRIVGAALALRLDPGAGGLPRTTDYVALLFSNEPPIGRVIDARYEERPFPEPEAPGLGFLREVTTVSMAEVGPSLAPLGELATRTRVAPGGEVATTIGLVDRYLEAPDGRLFFVLKQAEGFTGSQGRGRLPFVPVEVTGRSPLPTVGSAVAVSGRVVPLGGDSRLREGGDGVEPREVGWALLADDVVLVAGAEAEGYSAIDRLFEVVADEYVGRATVLRFPDRLPPPSPPPSAPRPAPVIVEEVPTRPPEPSPNDGHIVLVEGAYLRWNRGSSHGVERGLKVWVYRGSQRIGAGEVIDVLEDQSYVELSEITGAEKIEPGDRVEIRR